MKKIVSILFALVLVVSFALPAYGPGSWSVFGSGSGSGSGERISFEITTMPGEWDDIGIMVTSDLQDFGLDVTRRLVDAATYWDTRNLPDLGGIEAFISGEDLGPDPWSDYIWQMLADPTGLGAWWNPCWYDNSRYNELFMENYMAPNLSAKREILYEMQEILAEDLPVIYLTRDDIITVRRTDTWDNWFNEMGGYVRWMNEYSIREVTPKAGNTEKQLNIGLLRLMDSLNMEDQLSLQYTNVGCLYLMLVYENLAFYPKIDPLTLNATPDNAYKFVPKLATNCSWGTEGTNQTLTIDLRPDVKWHDFDTSGETLDADDVVYSFKNIIQPWRVNMPIDWTAVEANDLEFWEIEPEHVLVEATGPLQVTFTYIEGYHQGEDFFPVYHLWYAIVPQHIFELESDPLEATGDYVGTGPYKVKEFVADDHLLLERNNAYWGDLPAAKQVLFTLFADTGSMMIALEKGDIDVTMAQGAPHQKVFEYMANPDIEVEIVPDLTINYLGFNLHPTAGYAPLQNMTLRKAIAHAIDKEGIVNWVLGGHGEVADAWIYNESPMHNPGLPQYTFNPTEAAQILTDAGYTKDDEGYWCLPVVDTKTETVTDDTVDATEEADTEVEVDGTATVTVARYEDNPGGDDPTDFNALDKYIDVYVPDTSEVTEIEIRLYYTDAEVEAAGVDEESLRLLWWDGAEWSECSPDSGVNTASINSYSGYMWAKIRATGTTPSLEDLQGTEFGGYGHPSETPGGCFIATAAYGTDTAGELDMLREFRDAVLLPNSLGAEFVSLYYKTSPPLANFISQQEILRTAVRVGFVDPIVKILTWTHDLWST